MAARDLESEVRERMALPLVEAVDVVVEIAEALARAHDRGQISGRVTAANIFVERGAFGSATLRQPAPGSRASQTNPSPRAPLYLSPEQLAERTDIDAAADIWSLAVVLYEAIAGRPPFLDTSAIKRGEFPQLRSLRAGCPPQLEMAITSCLQVDPAMRTPSIASFALSIAPFGSSRSEALVDKLKAMEPPTSERTLYVAAAEPITAPPPPMAEEQVLEEEERHAADDEGSTVMVPTSARFDQAEAPEPPPALPAMPPSRPARKPLVTDDKTERISSAALQELGRRIGDAKMGQPPSQPPSQPGMRPPPPELATVTGTPISNIRVRNGMPTGPAPITPEIRQVRSSRVPMIVAIVATLVFVATVSAAAFILYRAKPLRAR